MHYGGAWHVSLTKGLRCVDLRKFFIPMGQTLWKPTKTGIALRLNELPTFKQAVDKLHRDNPTVANFTPCFLIVDHTHHSRARRDLFGVQSDHLLTTAIERCT